MRSSTMSNEKPDFYCPKCKHGLLEAQVPRDPPSCPRCKGAVQDVRDGVIHGVTMFKPKLARLEVKVGAPVVTAAGPAPAKEKYVKDTCALPSGSTMFSIAKAVVLVDRVLNTIADRIENDGAEPTLAVGTDPTKLWLLGEALEAVGRPEAARIAYEASADHQGDDPKET
jgi:hypothetical protein